MSEVGAERHATERERAAPAVHVDEGLVTSVDGPRLTVAIDGGASPARGPDSGRCISARRARGISPVSGDRVLLLHAPGGPVAVAVVATEDDLEEPRFTRGEDGACELTWGGGDLTLRAPHGELRVAAGTDLVLEAARELRQLAGSRAVVASGAGARGGRLELDGRGATLAGATLRAHARKAELEARETTIVAHAIATTVDTLVTRVERYELHAGRILESARESLREASELAEVRAERLKTRVRDAWSVLAGRTTIVSEHDTSIDGQRVLLG